MRCLVIRGTGVTDHCHLASIKMVKYKLKWLDLVRASMYDVNIFFSMWQGLNYLLGHTFLY